MSSDEMSAIFKAKSEAERTSWEQTRLLAFYNVISMNGTKEIKTAKDLFQLPWDDDKSKGKQLTREEFFEEAKKLKN